jgi:hypothetical protein
LATSLPELGSVVELIVAVFVRLPAGAVDDTVATIVYTTLAPAGRVGRATLRLRVVPGATQLPPAQLHGLEPVRSKAGGVSATVMLFAVVAPRFLTVTV